MYNIIGLTGGIASGKSTASEYIRSRSILFWMRMNFHGKQRQKAVRPEGIILKLSERTLQVNGEIDRRKLGSIIFNDPRKEILNQLVHPEIRRMMNKERDRLVKENHVFLDIPLLFENNLDGQCDITLTVYVDEKTQKKIDGTQRVHRRGSRFPHKRSDAVI